MTHDESLIYIGVADGRVFSAETASLPMGVLSWKTLRQFAAVDGEPTVTCMALWMNDLCVAYGDGVVRFYDGFSGVMTRSYTKHNTTAAIDALHVIDASKISEQEVTLFPDGLGRVRKYAHELAQEEETDMVPIEMCTGKKVGDVAWNLVDDAMEEVFSVQTSVQISLGDREKALAEEVEILRRRNVELEAAGRRLIQLVEKDNG